MKNLLISLMVLSASLGAFAQDQGVSVRATNGYLQANSPYRVAVDVSAARFGVFNGNSTGSNLRALNGALSLAEMLSATNCLPFSLAGSLSAGRFQGATTSTNVATVGSAAFGDYLNAISCTTTSTLGSIAVSELEASANSHNLASDGSLSLLSASAASNVNVFALNGSSAHIYAPGVTNASLTANGAIVMGTLANNTTNNVTNSIAFVGSGGIAGLINASGFTGNGAGVTNIPASSVSGAWTNTVGTRTFRHDSTATIITNTATLTGTEFANGQRKDYYNGTNTFTLNKTNGDFNFLGTATGNGAGLTNLLGDASGFTNLNPVKLLLEGADPLIANRNYGQFVTVTNGISNMVAQVTGTLAYRVLVYVPNGTYDECVDMSGHPYVDVVGQSRTGVIVTSTNTSLDTFKIGGTDTMLAHMTIRHITPVSATQQYPIHCDSSTGAADGGAGAEVNMILYDITAAASGGNGKSGIGAGLYANQRLTAINSTFTSDAAAGVFVHNQATQTNLMRAQFLNCVGVSTNDQGFAFSNLGSGNADLVTIVGGYYSGGTTGVHFYGATTEARLALNTSGDLPTVVAGPVKMWLVNSNNWMQTTLLPERPRPTLMNWFDYQTTSGGVSNPPMVVVKNKLNVGIPVGAYQGNWSSTMNAFGPYNSDYGTLGLFSTTTAAQNKGGSVSFGGPNGSGSTPTVFSTILGTLDAASGTAGNLIFSTMSSGGTMTEAYRVNNRQALYATNGILFFARDTIPTNAIPASTSTYTNWTLINWTNTGPVFIATNIAAAGSFLKAVPTLTITAWP